MKHQMPNVDIATVVDVIQQCFEKEKALEMIQVLNLVVKKNGSIRTTKPNVDDSNPLTGMAAYV